MLDLVKQHYSKISKTQEKIVYQVFRRQSVAFLQQALAAKVIERPCDLENAWEYPVTHAGCVFAIKRVLVQE